MKMELTNTLADNYSEYGSVIYIDGIMYTSLSIF